MTAFYAHTLEGESLDKWEPLFTPFGQGVAECPRDACEKCARLDANHGHLNKVAWWTAKFAEEMFPPGSAEAKSARAWGYLAGLWHDLGKFAREFQRYLRFVGSVDAHLEEQGVPGRVDHSSAGAQRADRSISILGRLVAYIIAGHHAGLPNGMDGLIAQSSLQSRLAKSLPDFSDVPKEISEFAPSAKFPAFALRSPTATPVFLRMFFSCLVDADFLATEAFMSAEQSRSRIDYHPSVAELEDALQNFLAKFATHSPINKQRAEILRACLAAAKMPPGLFSLTVPTGGGKTLSSLAFALRHARLHGLKRVIYVIPFTSIIEQNAAIFRQVMAAFGPEVVVEHHSNLDPEKVTRASRLAAENWDARIIVTTNVQFFESFHANQPSRCRKLHNIARSVVVLDEAQTLPVPLLQPCLRVLEEITAHYHSSVVLCTATQPAIHWREDFPVGIPKPTEIIPDPAKLYTALRRVTVENLGPLSDEALCARLEAQEQALCVVKTRPHARKICRMLQRREGVFHLSANLCPEHRSAVIATIRCRLTEGLPCLVISTQLIEAGVDLDFPVAYRALAGIDSVAQTAGRCNRESKLPQNGIAYIFVSEGGVPPGALRSAADSAAEVLKCDPDDILSLETVEAYFSLHFWKNADATDSHDIAGCFPRQMPRSPDDLLGYQFKTAAERFRFIDNPQKPVIIPWKNGRALCDELLATYDPARLRLLIRKLQRYIVQIPERLHSHHVQTGVIQLVHDQFPVLNSDVHYHDDLGLDLDGPPSAQDTVI